MNPDQLTQLRLASVDFAIKAQSENIVETAEQIFDYLAKTLTDYEATKVAEKAASNIGILRSVTE